jgi:branched-chain amino acid transport system substrate-binding protein
VRLVVGDDGSDPGRALSLAKRMVEQDRVLALYADMMGLTLQGVTPYLEQQQVPLVGGCTCNGNAGESPMVFYVGSYPGEGLNWGHVLPLTTYTQKRKVSVIWCREAPACQSIRDGVRKIAAQAGITIVHDAQVSLAQPDFTGEVLAAQSAGAEAILAATDNFSIIRIARAAHRQNYDPAIVGQWSAHDERFLSTGGKDIEGVYIAGAMPDWNSPKLAEYRSVLDRYVPGATKASLGMAAWAAGKLLEVVAPGLPPNPTPQDLVKALYKVKGETLGGLIPPLAYQEGQRHGDSNGCSIPFQVHDGTFVPKNGDNWLCPPGWQPVQK